MKLFFLFLIVCIIILNTNQVFAGEKKPPKIIQYDLPKEQITQARLLEAYIIRYAANINDSAQKFGVGTHIFVRDTYIELKNMKQLLEKVQRKELSSTQSKKELSQIVTKLKNRNIKLQSFFRQEKKELRKKIARKKDGYNTFSIKLSKAIENLIYSFTQNLLKKKKHSDNEKNIARILVQLQKENNKLKGFTHKEFLFEQDMRYYLRERIENIRFYMSNIKELSR